MTARTFAQRYRPTVEELYDAESSSLLSLIEEKISYYVSASYKLDRSLDTYDLWQLIHKINDFQTDMVEVKYLRKSVSDHLIKLTKDVEADYRDKIKSLEKACQSINTQIFETEQKKRDMIFRSILTGKWPFTREYNDMDYRLITLKNKLKYNERQIQHMIEHRATLNQAECHRLLENLKCSFFT